jgi:hypothetical protein
MGFPVWLALPADLFERLKDFWVLGLEPPIHGDVLRGVFVEEDQRVSDVVGFGDGGRDFFHHRFLSLGANARGASIKQIGIGALPFGSWIYAFSPLKVTCRYNLGLVMAAGLLVQLRIAGHESSLSRKNYSLFGAVVQVQRAISNKGCVYRRCPEYFVP